ncbi:protein of unknown function [Tenacibaculum jejuense]|uniref:Permease n=1 Tax=Tenacibaculum jejuense TaxID=584609 RepID=A0A238UDK4_9FLAO|nr:protein of unknown function [Tenacibaculum jejuense]
MFFKHHISMYFLSSTVEPVSLLILILAMFLGSKNIAKINKVQYRILSDLIKILI